MKTMSFFLSVIAVVIISSLSILAQNKGTTKKEAPVSKNEKLGIAGKSQTRQTCNIIDYYGDFIKFKKEVYQGRDYLLKGIVEVAPGKCFASVVNNTMYIDYLLTNYASNSNYQELLAIKDTVVLQEEGIKSLQSDTTFNQVMTELISKTFDKSIPRDSVSIDKLLNVAVKFFSIQRINKDGDYMGKVCVGMNDIKKTEKIKKPQLEAFCFSSILKNYQGGKFNMQDEFIKSLKELYKVNLGIDENDRLLRAQGGMYFLMRNSETLKKMLRSEYEENKDNLPFILKD